MGIVRVDDPSSLEMEWPHAEEAFVSVSSYLRESVPMNVGATVWNDGVSVHFPSVQLIGIPNCVGRPFGYCGNDFGFVRNLDDKIINRIEERTKTIGRWLHGYGYRGTFGVDYLLVDGDLLFTEVNPRFQGSTHLSCRLSIEAQEGCLMLEHIGALLGMSAPPRRPLLEYVREVPPISHFVVHWLGNSAKHLDPTPLANALIGQSSTAGVDVLTKPNLLTEINAVVGRFTVRDSVTNTGYDLSEPWTSMIDSWKMASDGGTFLHPSMDEGTRKNAAISS
jgi:hypothetical protein